MKTRCQEVGGWPRLNFEKRLGSPNPCEFASCKGEVFALVPFLFCSSAGRPAFPSSRRFATRMLFSQVGKEDRRAVGKLGNDVHLATHGFDRFSQRGEQQVAAFFKPGDAVLGDPESLGNAGLRKLAGLSQVAQAHFLGYEFSRTVLDLLSLGWAQLPNDFIHIHGHGYVPFPIRARWASRRSSAFRISSR